MAIYHLEAKIVTRGVGRSACGAAAYMSCSRIYNDYDGVQHDYTRKGGLVWREGFLPSMAPPEWKDREKLWNAVEAAEKTKDSRLAREFIVALPVELGREEWVALLSDFIRKNFVADGMCADAAIHDVDGHNPHAHILLTVRPLNEKGAWQQKTEKEYLCVRNGEERGFTAAEFKTAQSEGWEKQYQYKVGKKKVYMVPSEAEKQGLTRASKYPKSTKFGRQNPITARWNSEDQLVAWRTAWADTVNLALERRHCAARIDHRSYAERGIDEQPTIHEGVTAREMEKQGIVSERSELNRAIREDNRLLRELKAMVVKLAEKVATTVADIARAMETARQNLIVLMFCLTHTRNRRREAFLHWNETSYKYKRYQKLRGQIKAKVNERRELKKKLASLSFLGIRKRKELTAQIEGLSGELEELRFEEQSILRELGKTDADVMREIKNHLADVESSIGKMDEREAQYAGDIEKVRQEFDALKEQAAGFDQDELVAARLALRRQMDRETRSRIHEAAHGERISIWSFETSAKEVDRLLGEKNMAKGHGRKERVRKIEQERI